MLKLKVKEKLLNRLNDLDVTEVIDSNGNHIAIEELISWAGTIEPLLRTYEGDIATYLDTSNLDVEGNLMLDLGLEGLVDENEKPLIPSGKVSNVWDRNGFIESENPDFTNIKKGDIIVDQDYAFTLIVGYVDSNQITMYGLDDEATPYVVTYNFTYESWSKTPFDKGTKLYKHRIELSNGDEVCLITTRSISYNNIIQFVNIISNGEYISGSFYRATEDAYVGIILSINDGSISYYDDALTQIGTLSLPNITISSDTVTPL